MVHDNISKAAKEGKTRSVQDLKDWTSSKLQNVKSFDKIESKTGIDRAYIAFGVVIIVAGFAVLTVGGASCY